jgi:hypothetical protein
MSTPGIGTAETPAEIAAACAPAIGSVRALGQFHHLKSAAKPARRCVFF